MHLRCAIGEGGGPDKTLRAELDQVDRERFRLIVVYVRKSVDPSFQIPDRYEGVDDFHVVEERSLFDARARRAILARMEIDRPDILHTHDFKTDVWGLMLRRRATAPVKLMTTTHGWCPETFRERVYGFGNVLTLRFFDLVTCLNSDQERLLRRFGVPASRLRRLTQLGANDQVASSCPPNA